MNHAKQEREHDALNDNESEGESLENSIISTSEPQVVSTLLSSKAHEGKNEMGQGVKADGISQSAEHLFLNLTNLCSSKHGKKELDLEIIEKVSEASNSRLFKVLEKKSEKILFLKEFELRDKRDKQYASNEFKTLTTFLNQAQDSFVDIVFTHSKPNMLDPEQPIRRYYFLLDAAEGSLKDLALFYQSKGKDWSKEQLSLVFLRLVQQLQALYEVGVINRDIKPEHLIFSNEGIKVIDFGHAHNSWKAEETRAKHSVVGTVDYLAPELRRAHDKMVNRLQYDPTKSDSYSVAKTILTLNAPNNQNLQELITIMKEKQPELFSQIENLLKDDPAERLSFLSLQTDELKQDELKKGLLATDEERTEFRQFVLNNRIQDTSNEGLLEQAVVYSQLGLQQKLGEVLTTIGPKSERFGQFSSIQKIRLLDIAGEHANSQKNINEAIDCHTQGLELKSKLLGKNNNSLVFTYTTLAKLYLKAQNYTKAIENYEIFVEICKERSLDGLELGFSYHELGMLYEQANNLAKAKENYDNSLKLIKAASASHSKLFNLYNSLGNLEEKMGHYPEAVEFLQLALNIRLKHVPADHPSLAASYNNLGLALERSGKLKYALENYQKALGIWLKSVGEQSEYVATAYNNIGSAHDSLGERKQAVEYFEKALALRIQLFGHEHPSIAQIFNNLGTSYFHLQQFEKALENYQKCLTIWKKVYGEENNKVATVYNNIANVYTSLKNRSEAKEYFAKAVEIKGKVLGKSHPSLATTYANLGVIYLENNEKEKALEFLELAYEIRNQQFGKSNPATQDVYNMVVKLKKSLGK